MSAEAETAELLAWSYNGEVYGEALFSTMAELCANPVQREQLCALAGLEAQTKELVHPLVPAGAEESWQVTRGEKHARQFAARPWSDFLSMFKPATADALDRYRRVLALSTNDSLTAAAQVLIDHEEALQDFARAALQGDENALDPVLRLVDRPDDR